VRESLRANLMANFAGRGWLSVVRLIFIPIFLHYLGIEAFALVTLCNTLSAVLLVLDLGLSPMLSRELARLADSPAHEQEIRDLSRTLEAICWTVAILIAGGIAAAAPWLSNNWVQANSLSPGSVQIAFVAMGAVIGVQWPTSLYTSGLLGQQRHTSLNAVTIAIATLQNVGAVFVLKFISPTIAAYFAWQIFASLLLVGALGRLFWRNLTPIGSRAHVRLELLRSRWQFAGGIAAASVAYTVVSQADKIILSKLLSLSDFGYYAFAFSAASPLLYVSSPICTAVYPRLVQLVSRPGETRQLADLYHRTAQLMSALLFPLSVLLVVFPTELLSIYSRNPVLAERSGPLLALLSVGISVNALMLLPSFLQLSTGWTSLAVVKNIIGACAYIPLLIGLIRSSGTIGAASAVMLLNLAYLAFEVPIMHRRILRTEMHAWLWKDLARPLAATLVVALCARQAVAIVPLSALPWYLLVVLVGMFAAASVAVPAPALIAVTTLGAWARRVLAYERGSR
jgi:O-antigen/teichoic acid export membrane protein